MAIYKVSLDDFEDDDFCIIAIYTPLDDYRLVYKLNIACRLNLVRAKEDLVCSENEYHAFFDYEDKKNAKYYALLKNKSKVMLQKEPGELFHYNGVVYVLPEYKKADFLLKIEPKNGRLIENIMTSLKQLDQITTARVIDHGKIKNKSNLIF
jgi:hypothetical protein